MMRRFGKGGISMRKLVLALGTVCVLAFGVSMAAASAATVTPVASGLDSPRGLAFLANGALAVAEAGHGGDVCFPNGPCIGMSGQISTINRATGSHTPIVSGLFSAREPDGGSIGVDGLSSQGGRLLAIMGAFPQAFDGATCAGQPADCPQVLATARAQAGQLLNVRASGKWTTIAGVGAYDYQWTVDHHSIYGGETDANPYGVLALPDGTYVADAGSNTLDWVGNDGDISVLDHFPNPNPPEPFPADAVPTCIAASSDGQLYVGDLAGRIWAVDGGSDEQDNQAGDDANHDGNSPREPARLVSGQSGNHYTGCAADRSGNVYFVSMFAGLFPNPGTGSIVKLTAGGTVSTLATGPLVFPNGITVRRDSALYVSVNSICGSSPGGACGPLTGGVVKIRP
jgi:hypothetical protein